MILNVKNCFKGTYLRSTLVGVFHPVFYTINVYPILDNFDILTIFKLYDIQ